MEERNILLDIHQMLCKVCNYIDKVESPEYIQKENEREFILNVVADIYVEQLERFRNGTINNSTN